MTGLSFFTGGLHCLEQYFDATLAQTIGMLLLLACLSLVIPTAAHSLGNTSPKGITQQSRGTAIIIMISYILWLLFQLKYNRELFDNPEKREKKKRKLTDQQRMKLEARQEVKRQLKRAWDAKINRANPPSTISITPVDSDVIASDSSDGPSDGEPDATLSYATCFITLIISTVLIAYNTELATRTIEGLLTDAGLSETFVGLIIIPLLNIDPMCISVANLDNVDLSISLTLERCMQTALMVVPFIVLLAWWMHIPEMNMEFDTFPVLALFASIIMVTYVVQQGKSNWLTGALLVKVYILIGLSSYYVGTAESIQ
ncbi:hypothetical protein BT63DRAFT_45102 [Microthyrium microscopicum]|uniref:Sodium/calcium exchanger membrane region domain-containing protein n=1 Tax=Microthyrium microscopicum TaxID=703497 RepID=A0A6A6U1H4_9PEZI|nr:hypothetical protein BT63DRAFT_45102 [Microthyrium microscopicum]